MAPACSPVVPSAECRGAAQRTAHLHPPNIYPASLPEGPEDAITITWSLKEQREQCGERSE